MGIVADILTAASVERKGRAPEIRICCPFCIENGESADTRFRLGINLQRSVAHCYNCEYRSGGVRKTAKDLAKAFGVSYDLHAALLKREEKERVEAEKPVPRGLPDAYEPFRRGYDEIQEAALVFLQSRGVTTSQIEAHKIGYAAAGPMAWRVLLPVIGRDGAIYGCVGRDFSGQSSVKYLNTPGMKLMWGAERKASVAILAEGVFDALRIERALPNVVALARLGTAITADQLEQLSTYDCLTILPDRDLPGVQGAIALAKRCVGEGMDVRVSVPQILDDRDPGDMGLEEIREAVQRAIPWNRAAEWTLRAIAARQP